MSTKELGEYLRGLEARIKDLEGQVTALGGLAWLDAADRAEAPQPARPSAEALNLAARMLANSLNMMTEGNPAVAKLVDVSIWLDRMSRGEV